MKLGTQSRWTSYFLRKYYMISDLQKRLFTNFLQNSYFLINFASYKNVMESFFKIKTLKNLKEVMEPFLNVKTLRVPRKWWRPFSVLKTLRQWWCLFSGLKTLRVVKKQRSPFFSIKNFKSRKAVVEFYLSFKRFKSCEKVTVRVLFQFPRFIKLSYDYQISWNKIFSVSSHWFSLIMITF